MKRIPFRNSVHFNGKGIINFDFQMLKEYLENDCIISGIQRVLWNVGKIIPFGEIVGGNIIRIKYSGVVRNLNLGVPKNFFHAYPKNFEKIRTYHLVTYKI